ncbi:nitrite/sulfite reductase [bacterium]|nr:nitrite/sulfite reductase [bacterium]
MYKLPLNLKEELNQYKIELKKFSDSQITASEFKNTHVPWGIYPHRGGKSYMIRIRVASAEITPGQLNVLAELAAEYGDSRIHLTTREDIQIHNIDIKNSITIMERLMDFELASRGGGGNTGRNVLICPRAGVCAKEIFNVAEHVKSATSLILSDQSWCKLPRKLKIAFSGCSNDCTGCLINDIGFIAQLKNGKKGFKVFAAGKMGSKYKIGFLLEQFLPEADILKCISAVKNIFALKGDRNNRNRNRLRFLVEQIGKDEFIRLYGEQIKLLSENEAQTLIPESIRYTNSDDAHIPQIDDKHYKAFLKYNVIPEKQTGFSSVELRIPRGDILSDNVFLLTALTKKYNSIIFRLSQEQNLLICRVENKNLADIFLDIKKIMPDFLYPRTLLDIVCCTGALTCNLGLCNSQGLTKYLEKKIAEFFIDKEVFKKLNIKINGCPNACGHHPIGKISFQGMAKKVEGRFVPCYRVLTGGSKNGENTCFAKSIGVIPAKSICLFLNDFLRNIEDGLKKCSNVDDYMRNDATQIAQRVINSYLPIPSYDENRDYYVDFGKKNDFSLDALRQAQP